MKNLTVVLAFLLAALDASTMQAQNPKYSPLSEYMMTAEAEVALARSAAPENVSAHATVKVLTASGYKVAAQGDNGFICLVMRGWSAPTYSPAQFRELVYDAGVRAPICFNPPSSQAGTAVLRATKQTGNGRKDAGPDQRECASGRCQGPASAEG